MIMIEATLKIIRPDLENSTAEDFEAASATLRALLVAVAEPIDISRAVVFLASDNARLITGVTLPIDAGLLLK